MKRLVLASLVSFGCAVPLAHAQGDNSNSVNVGPNELPDPQPPRVPDCEDGCGNTVSAEITSDGEYACPPGSTEVTNDSLGLRLNFGLTTYSTSSNFLAHDKALCMPPSKNYNPPSVSPPPLRDSLVKHWGKQNKRPVCFMLRAPDPSTGVIKPNSFETYGHSGTTATGSGAWSGPYFERATPGKAYIKRDPGADRFQVMSDQFLVDAKTENSSTVIRYYPKGVAGQKDSTTGFYPVAPNPQTLKTVKISQPSANVVSVVQDEYFSSFTNPKTRGYRWAINGNTSTLTRHAGEPHICYPYERDRLVKTDLGNGLIQRVRTVDRAVSGNFPVGYYPAPPPPGYVPESDTPPGGYTTVSRTMEQYRDLGAGKLRIYKKVEGYQTSKELTTEYTYTSSDGKWSVSSSGQIWPRSGGSVAPPPGTQIPSNLSSVSVNDYLGGRLATLRRSDGYWEDYSYDFNAGSGTMLTRIWSSWKNSAPGDHANAKETIITLDQGSRTVLVKIAGQLISSEFEKLTVTSDGTRVFREEKKSGANTALVTETAYFPDSAPEPNTGRIKYVRHSDGTLTRYTYSTVADFTAPGQTALKTIMETGVADAAQSEPGATGPVPALTKGTRAETVTNMFEKVIETKVYDIASGLLLDQSLASTVDSVGRPTHVIHDGDTDDYEQFTFACCGVKTHRGRDGSLTEYSKDAFGRPYETIVTLGPKTTKTSYSYSTEEYGDQTLPKTTVQKSITAGSNSTGTLLVSETIRDLKGRTLVSRTPDSDGDGQVDVTTYDYNAPDRTSSYTNARGTTTSVYFADGQLASSVTKVGELIITPVTSYDYAVHTQNGGGLKTSVSTSGAGTGHIYADLAGRTFRTESPGYDGSTIVSTTTFDTRGRASGQSSTGKPATLRVLNTLGEITEFWTDSNGDGLFNNSAVNDTKDSCRMSSSDYVTEDGRVCRRIQQWVLNDSDADILVSTTYTSTDGLYQKSVPLAGIGPVTITTATRPINGNSSRLTTTGIGTGSLTSEQSVTLNADGTTTTESTQKDTAGAVISSASSTADIQGRTISQTGERGLITSYSDFTAAGQALGVTSQGTYTKTTLDTQGRATQTVTRKDTSTGSVIATVNTDYSYAADGGLVTVRYGTNTYPTLTRQNIHGRTVELRTFRESNLAFTPTANTTGGDKTTWNYEATTGLLLSKRDNEEKGATYTYTADGKLLTRAWTRGVTTTYDHTLGGQIKAINYSDNTPDVTITYNRLGQRLSVSNGLAASDFTYDPATLALDKEAITYTLPNQPAFTRILDRSRDNLGRDKGYSLGSAGVPPASGGILPPPETQATYGYSATTGRLETVSNGTASFRYDYHANSSLIEHVVATAGAVHDVHLAYEPTRNVLASRQNKVGTTTVSGYDYSVVNEGVNSLGQRTGVKTTFNLGAGQSSNAGDTSWGYDALGQVVSAATPNSTADRAYQFDTIGNRKKTSNTLTLPGTDNWGVNPLNQLTKVDGEDLPADSYDSDGNQLNAKVLPLGSSSLASCVYSWDAENRLIETTVGTNGPLVQNYYDSQSRRIARTAGGETTVYVYDSWNCIAEYSIQNSTFSIQHSNLWGLDLSGSLQGAGGVGGLLSVTSHSALLTSHFPSYDGNGNVSEYLTSTGTVAAHFEYDPFGNTVVNTDATNQFAYRFSTKPQDSTTGLLYYGYRFYDPLTGRWPSRDPIGEEGGVNIYGFIGNDGIYGWDYVGLKRLSLTYVIWGSVDTTKEKNLHRLNGHTAVASLEGLLSDMDKKVKPAYHRSGLDPCNCVENLTIWSHNAGSGFYVSLDDYISIGDFRVREDYRKQLNDITLHSTNKSKDYKDLMKKYSKGLLADSLRRASAFASIKEYLCENAKVYLKVCYLDNSKAGKEFIKKVEELLGVSVVAYDKQISPPYPPLIGDDELQP